MKRRSFLGLLGVAPLAAKAAAEAEMAKQIGLSGGYGGGAINALNAGGMVGQAPNGLSNQIPYEQRLSGASTYIKTFGLPESIDRELRENTYYVGQLDPDIACKKSWSMSVKIMTQRQRNYQRGIDRMMDFGWQMRGREAISKVLGFTWPW